MTEQAQNALLLTLEEPPAYAVFILLCESAAALLETIRSRAPVFRTELMSTAEIEKCILEKSEKARAIKAQDPSLFAQISVSAGGTVGRALDYLDERRFAPIKSARAIAYETLELLSSGADAGKSIALIGKFPTKREALALQLELIADAATELLVLKRCEQRQLVFFESEQRALELCESVSASRLFTLCEAIQEALDENSRNANVRLLLMKMASRIGII